MLIYTQSLIEKFKLCYSLQASKHNAPYKNNHCDTKSESCNHTFTQKLRKLALNTYSFTYATSPTWQCFHFRKTSFGFYFKVAKLWSLKYFIV
jgi:hypothetical protein